MRRFSYQNLPDHVAIGGTLVRHGHAVKRRRANVGMPQKFLPHLEGRTGFSQQCGVPVPKADHAVCVELGLSFFGIHNTTSVCGEWSGRWGSNPRKQVFGSSVSKPLVTSMKRINGTIPVVCVIALAFFSCSVASAHAQNPQITSETNVDSSLGKLFTGCACRCHQCS